MVVLFLLSINTLSSSSVLLYSSLHLPTTIPIPSKETDYPAKPADLTTPSLTRTTNSENYNIGAETNCKKKGQKRKANADINKDTKGHGILRLTRGRHDRVSHICRESLDTDNSSLRLFSQHNSLLRREKNNITAARKAPPKYKREQTANSEWVWNKVTSYTQGQCNVYQSYYSRLNGDTWLDDSIIDMVLLVTVQDTVPGVHYYTSHFFNILEKGKYVGFGPRGITPNLPNTPCEDLQAFSFRVLWIPVMITVVSMSAFCLTVSH